MNIRLGDDPPLTDDQRRQIAASFHKGISSSVQAVEAQGKAQAALQAAAEAAASARSSAYNDGVIAAGGFRPAASKLPLIAAVAVAYFALKGH